MDGLQVLWIQGVGDCDQGGGEHDDVLWVVRPRYLGILIHVLHVHVLGMEVGLQGVEDCGCDQGGAEHNDV